jgi:hypothetical protein
MKNLLVIKLWSIHDQSMLFIISLCLQFLYEIIMFLVH